MDQGKFAHLTDAQFESVRKMAGIIRGDALRSLAVATPAEQVELIEAFDTYGQGFIAQVQGLQGPVTELKPAQPKPLRLKVNLRREGGKEPPFWVREVELAMEAALILTKQLLVAFVLFSLSAWLALRRPGCTRARRRRRVALQPGLRYTNNPEFRQCSHFLACKQGEREQHEYITEMRVLAASLIGNPLPEHIKVVMSILHAVVPRTSVHNGGRSRSPSKRSTATDTLIFLRQCDKATGHQQDAVQETPGIGASTGPVAMELDMTVQSAIHCYGFGKLGFMWEGKGNSAHHGGLSPECLVALETKKKSDDRRKVRGYGDSFRILTVSGASTNFAQRQMVASNSDKFVNALREGEGRG
ncbi:Gag protein [Phytophthora palmivora]|uniref:Gag protein n=1 Tax=Phytophthora palmivora TaxID=4796 RepID=A0A2P4XGP9_9STRA|nr:Gag protein [Phytophthora palmivora]